MGDELQNQKPWSSSHNLLAALWLWVCLFRRLSWPVSHEDSRPSLTSRQVVWSETLLGGLAWLRVDLSNLYCLQKLRKVGGGALVLWPVSGTSWSSWVDFSLSFNQPILEPPESWWVSLQEGRFNFWGNCYTVEQKHKDGRISTL